MKNLLIVFILTFLFFSCDSIALLYKDLQTTPPTVASTSPSNGSTAVLTSITTFDITFSHEMAEIYSISINEDGIIESHEWVDSKHLQLKFTRELLPNFEYEIILNPSENKKMASADGVLLAENTKITFTTSEYSTAPIIISSTPTNGTENVAIDTAYLDVVFNQIMSTHISLSTNEEGIVGSFEDGAYEWLDDKKTLRINFSRELSPGHTYSFTFNPTDHVNMKNTSDIQLAENTRIGFSTAPYTTAPVISLLSIPDNSTDISVETEFVDIFFDQVMQASYSISTNNQDLISSVEWITARNLRINFIQQLAPGLTYTIILNPTGHVSMQNCSNILLAENTSFSFTSAGDPWILQFGRESYFPIIENSTWTDNDGKTTRLSMVDTTKNSFRIENYGDETHYMNGQVSTDEHGIYVKTSGYSNPWYIAVKYTMGFTPLIYENAGLTAEFTWSSSLTSNNYVVNQNYIIESVGTSLTTPGGQTYNDCVKIVVDYVYPDGYDNEPFITKHTCYFQKGVGCVQSERIYSDSSTQTFYITAYTIP